MVGRARKVSTLLKGEGGCKQVLPCLEGGGAQKVSALGLIIDMH